VRICVRAKHWNVDCGKRTLGITHVSDVELKYLDWDKKAYDSIPVHEQVEVASC
jgi:predicted DNA-binding protein with PD1-like motif